MSNAENLTLLIAGASVVATALATMAAFRSAKSAQLAQTALAEAELLQMRRGVAHLLSEIERAHRHSHFLLRTLEVIDRTNARLIAVPHNQHQSRTRAKELVQEADGLIASSSPFLKEPATLARIPREDAERLLIERTPVLARLRSIADELSRESTSAEAQLLQVREASVSPFGGGAAK